ENVHPNLKHNFFGYTMWGMFSRDEGPDARTISTKNLYGVHPFYLLVEEDDAAHGVLFLNSNAQDVTNFSISHDLTPNLTDVTIFP
ncbi:hypothetical protein PMAYCL1PPCAC_33323, partial [Pristionchus mayeri]